MTAGTTLSRRICGVARQRCARAASGSSRSGRCCTTRATGCLATSCLWTCSPRLAGAACPADRGHGDGAAAAAGPVGPGSGRGVQLRCALEVCLWWAGVRLPGFSHTVLVDMRARLAASDRPERIFAVTVAAARQAGLVGVRRVLDSTPLYDAVATMDTVTLLGAAIRGLFKVAEGRLAAELRAVLVGGDDDASLAKPQIDRDDQAARAALVDARAQDARAVLGRLAAARSPRRWRWPPGCWRRWWARTWSTAATAASGSPQGRRRPGGLHRRPWCPPWPQEQRPRL